MADVTLTYKGSTILSLEDSATKTIKTGGKFCEGDIGVNYVKPSGGGEVSAAISVTYPAGSVCTATNGAITLTAADTSGVELFTLPEGGTWTVSCTDGVKSDSKTIAVSEHGVYTASLDIVVYGTFGGLSDEDFVTVINAAHNGAIDLQTYEGWQIGDTRTISFSGVKTDVGGYSLEGNFDIVISSFDDYENCGCVLQFDFKDALRNTYKMNDSATNTGGYQATNIYRTILPDLVSNLPSYLRDLLIQFSCKTSAGGGASTIQTVTGNKLALRSEIEVYGTTTYSYPGEGSQIPYYATAANRGSKTLGHGGSNSSWWERSPRTATSTTFCFVHANGPERGNANISLGIAPFGCI